MKKVIILGLSLILCLSGIVVAAPDGKELYTKTCKECHGVTGNGKSPAGKPLNPKVKNDLGDPAVQAKLTDAEIVKTITDGVKNDQGELTMKPLKEKKNLSDDDVKAIVQYVRTLKH